MPDSAAAPASDGVVADALDAEALLLLMADRLLFEPFAVRRIYRDYPEHHGRLALALGRTGDVRSRPYLTSMLADPDARVRTRAAFALGQLGDRDAFPDLLGALVDRTPEVATQAADSLARLGVALARVEAALGGLPEAERWRRLAPALFRFEPAEVDRTAGEVLASGRLRGSPELEAWVLYALARRGTAADGTSARLLRAALARRLELEPSPEPYAPAPAEAAGPTDGISDRGRSSDSGSGSESGPEPHAVAGTSADSGSDDLRSWVLGWLARGLGRLGDGSDLDRLRPLLALPDRSIRIQTLRAGRALVAEGRAAPAPAWVAPLADLLASADAGVRITAIQTAGYWSDLGPEGGADLGAELSSIASQAGWAGEVAVVALARRAGVRAEEAALEAARSADAGRRRAAAEAASILGLERVSDRLFGDADPAVRAAVLAGILEAGGGDAETRAREALLDPEPALRAQALEWLAEHPAAPIDELLLAVAEDAGRRLPDLEVACVRALAGRARVEALERGAIVAALEEFAKDVEWLVRRAASSALASLEREAPAPGSVQTDRSLRAYRDVALLARQSHELALTTEAGEIRFELDCETAPLTCVSFLKLAQNRYFDGLVFHRVVPDFVAQTGDPEGAGWGGPGFSLRDENGTIAYERGVVGMARSDPHTAGSQFFLTANRQPHLDGSYTAFGRVTRGLELLDRIQQGDRIRTLRTVP